MAITGIDTIEGKQIIAAGAVSAKSAEMAYNDENGNPITSYQIAGDYYSASNPSGFITGIPDTYLQNTDLEISDNKITGISGVPLDAGGQSTTDVAVYTNSNLPDSTQLDADIAAGKAICIVYNGRNYWYDRKSSDYYFYGADAYSGFLYYLFYRPSNNSWSTGQKVLATQSWVNDKSYLPSSAIELNGSDQVSAISGHPLVVGATYTAGANINITENVISGKDWSEDIISATSGLQPSGDYATESWVTSQGYLTAHQDISNLMPKSESANFYPMTGNPSGFINTLPEEEEVDFEEVDLTDYQPVSAMTAYQSAGDYYSASNPSGFITEVPAGTMNESAFGYDASDNITGYNGSAFKAGDEFPQSATEAIQVVTANSADWNSTTDTVSSNSGTWGGSALPISAGPGIKFEIVDGTLVASNDETVLYSGNLDTNNGATFTLSEPLNNFETIKIWANDNNSWAQVVFETDPNWAGSDNVWRRAIPLTLNTIDAGSNKIYFRGIALKSPTTTNITSCSAWGWEKMDGSNYTTHDCRITKIIGINRIAGGN